MSGPPSLARAREELAAARHLEGAGFPTQAISRSYYAAFYAAEEALRALGETRSKHSGVIAAFGEFVVVKGGVSPAVGRLLRSLFDQRIEADYGAAPPPASAGDVIEEAERFVQAVEAWLAGRGSPGRS